MKKNRRILGRALATEISDSELHKACGASEEEEGGSCPAESEGGDYGLTALVHHTNYHRDCHVDAWDYYN